MPTIYIIGGCNGAGKTTAASEILPKYLDCREFVNADSIAKGLSPFQPEKVSALAASILKSAKKDNYKIVLFYYWINSPKLALARIVDRVKKGGHNIPKDVVMRRYERSLYNLVNLFMPICDKWYITDNSSEKFYEIAKGTSHKQTIVYDNRKWGIIYDYKNK